MPRSTLVAAVVGTFVLAMGGALIACVGDDPAPVGTTPEGTDDASTADAAPAVDAGDASTDDAAQARCDVTRPFEAPRAVVGLRSTGATDFDTSPFLTNNGQAIYFASDRVGAGDILIATRVGVDSFGDVKALPGTVNTASDFEGSPFLTPDGLSLFFARGTTRPALFVATRASTTTAFEQSAAVTGLGTAQAQDNPFVTANGETLYFTNSTDGSTFDIYRATRGGDGAFAKPERMMELSYGTKNSRATLTDDELTVYFTSNQGGAFRIHSAHRADKTAAFGSIALVNELAIGDSSFTGHVSGDGCTMVFFAGTGTDNALEIQIADKPAK